jgi:hypothetical protein
MPARLMPCCRITHSALFGAQIAIRSPGENLASKARATCSAAATNSAYVH